MIGIGALVILAGLLFINYRFTQADDTSKDTISSKNI